MSRKKDTRQRAILDQLAISPTMRVGRLAETLDVTTETIRRDLEELSAQGMIARTYGGAMLRQPAEPALSERHLELVEERAAIGQAALPYLAEARVIMLGSGATTTQLAKFIAIEMHGLTVIAHSVSVASALSLNPTIQVVMAPGVYHAGEGALHGAQAVRFLSDYSADWSVTRGQRAVAAGAVGCADRRRRHLRHDAASERAAHGGGGPFQVRPHGHRALCRLGRDRRAGE